MAGSVLIVDDDPNVIESLRAVLPPEVDLVPAADAATANAMLDERKFCGMVLDLILIESSGFDVLQHMRARGVAIPTVVLSQKVPAYVREMLDEDLVKLVFTKPIETRLLAAVVLGLCGM